MEDLSEGNCRALPGLFEQLLLIKLKVFLESVVRVHRTHHATATALAWSVMQMFLRYLLYEKQNKFSWVSITGRLAPSELHEEIV